MTITLTGYRPITILCADKPIGPFFKRARTRYREYRKWTRITWEYFGPMRSGLHHRLPVG